LESVARRIPKLLAMMLSPEKARWRERCYSTFGRAGYSAELRTARLLRALCERAIRERWVRVPDGVDAALRAYETAKTNEARWSSLDEMKRLMEVRNDRMTFGKQNRPTRRT
jgi:hypothetical protein